VVTWAHTSDIGLAIPGEGVPTSTQLLADGYEICEGTIRVCVSAEYDHGYGCCNGSAEFTVEYSCTKCSNTYYPELPKDENAISALVTKVVADMDADAARLNERETVKIAAEEKALAWAEFKKRQEEEKRIRREKVVARKAAKGVTS